MAITVTLFLDEFHDFHGSVKPWFLLGDEEKQRAGRSGTVAKPENQLPITPLGKALAPRVHPTEYNGSYGAVL